MTPRIADVVRPLERGSIVTVITVTVLTSLLLLLALVLASPASAQAQQPEKKTTTGPIDPEFGFPYWYEDLEGTRLELCQNEALCLLELPTPGGPITFPDNFGAEQFWWTGEAIVEGDTNPSGVDALLVLAMEAAFANEEPVEGDQMSFGRVRIRVDGLVAGADYKVTHPYGEETFLNVDPVDEGSTVGEINVTRDIGCFPGALAKCDFDEANFSDIGPFLTWDTFGTDLDAPPAGFVGDPTVEHAVTGSPVPNTDANIPEHEFQNYFKLERLNAAGEVGERVAYTDQFAVSGKLAELRIKPQAVGAERAATVFNDADQKIKLISSDPAAGAFYTTDGSPVLDDEGNPIGTAYPGDPGFEGIPLNSAPDATTETTINFAAVKDGMEPVTGSKTYTVDLLGPNVTAESIDLGADPTDPNVVVNEGGGAFDNPQAVTLKANEPANIYYTTDGSNPEVEVVTDPITNEASVEVLNATEYTTPIEVKRTQTIKAIAIDVEVNTGTGERIVIGNKSQIKTFEYTIAAVSKVGPKNPATTSGENGYPFWYQDHLGTKLELCLNPQDQKCLVPFEMPNPDAARVSFADNFPGESFWWAGDAEAALPGGGDAQLVMAMEAAFANEEPVEGDQMSFGRIRIRIDGLRAGEKYTVTHPYGVDTFTAEPERRGSTVGEINVTEDIGCFPGAQVKCDFDEARFGRVGPFLTWDNFGQGDPALAGVDQHGTSIDDAYVGDPNVPHKVTGSPYDTNYFEVEGPGLGTDGVRTDDFTISGKVAQFQASVNLPGGSAPEQPRTFNQPRDIVLGASEEGAEVYYTTNGSDPDPNDSGQLYTGPFAIDSDTELKYMAVLRDEQGNLALDDPQRTTPVYTEHYAVDNTAPQGPTISLAADSDSGDKGDNITNDTTPTFEGTVAEPGSTVRIFFGNNARPEDTVTADANGNYSVTTGVLEDGEHSVTARATDPAGNEGPSSEALNLLIDSVAPGAPTADPSPDQVFQAPIEVVLSAADNQGGSGIEEILYSTDGNPPSTVFSGNIAVNSSTTISAKAIDIAGNESEEVSFAYRINVPNTAPTITIRSPLAGSVIRDRTPTIRAVVRDAETDLRRADMVLRLDGAVVNASYDRARDLLTFTPRNRLDLGRHTVRIVATDAEGLRQAQSWTFTIQRR